MAHCSSENVLTLLQLTRSKQTGEAKTGRGEEKGEEKWTRENFSGSGKYRASILSRTAP